MQEGGMEQFRNKDNSSLLWNRFAAIRHDEYKNPAMFELEPGYLKTASYSKNELNSQQWKRKITELALRLGREVKKNPEFLKKEEATKIFQELVGDVSQANEQVLFYENDTNQPTRLNACTDLPPLNFTSILEDAVEEIEIKGVNMQQKEEDRIFSGEKFVTEDKSRVRKIFLKNKEDDEQIEVVAKRVRLTRVRSNPFEELQIMQKLVSSELPSPKPIATLESRGNYYVLMEKVPGYNLKQIIKNPTLFREIMGEENFNINRVEDYFREIKDIMLEIETAYLSIGILRKNFQRDIQDIMVDYDKEKKEWKIVPIDFESVRLLKNNN